MQPRILKNVRDRIGSVLTNIYLSDIEYPDRKEKSNKRNPDIATFMAEVSRIILVVVIYSLVLFDGIRVAEHFSPSIYEHFRFRLMLRDSNIVKSSL